MFRPIGSLVKILGGFPLLIFPVVFYTGLVMMIGAEGVSNPALSVPTITQGSIALTWGEMLVLLAAFLLLPEWFKATDTSDLAILEMLLSLALAFLCLVLVISQAGFATPAFLIITVLQFVDGLGGIAAVRVARRDFGMGAGAG